MHRASTSIAASRLLLSLAAAHLLAGCEIDASTGERHHSSRRHDSDTSDTADAASGDESRDASSGGDKADAGEPRDAAKADRQPPDRTKDAAAPANGSSAENATDYDAATPPSTVGSYRTRKLANGLTVYTARDPNTANVTVQMFYKVGAKNDPAGRSGFAHLFEHLMFKGTRNLGNEAFDRLTEDVGGYNNAYTAADTTAYYEVVPANNLEAVLFAEADRLSSLVVDEVNFESERSVVEEEFRQSVLADPYGRLFELYVPQEAYQQHPYRRPNIGSIDNLEAATLENVRAFHSTFYRPDNAYLIVIGNFEEKQLDGWIDQYFGPVTRPERPIPTIDVTEPARTAARSVSYYAPNVPLPAVIVNWLVTRRDAPDTAALTVLDAILSSGSSSRLYQSLVYDQPLASDTGSVLDQAQQAGMFSLYAVAADGVSVMDCETALLAEAAKLRDAAVSTAELDQAKHELVAGLLRDREDVIGRGQALGEALIMTGDPTAPERELDQIQKVTAADVQRVARKYLTEESLLTLYYQSEADKPAGAPSEPRQPATDAPIKLEDLAPAGPVVEAASDADRKPIPAAGPEREIPTPQVSERRLQNGLRVLVAPQHDVALVSAELSFPAGATSDPPSKAGVASMTATVAGDGTSDKTALELAGAIEDIGATLGASASYDFTEVRANSPTDVFEQTAGLIAEIARQPAFAQEELTREKQQLLDGLTLDLSDPGAVAAAVIPRVAFGAAAYGSQVSGTTQTVPRITRTDLVNFHRAHWRPSTATLIISGDIEPDAAFALAERLFGDWQDAEGVMPGEAPANPAGEPVARRSIAIDLPMSGQAAVYTASRAIQRDDPGYFPLLVANAVLGGGYSARLNKEIRINRGLSYGAGSSFRARLRSGLVVASAQTRNDAAVEVAQLMLGEIGKLSNDFVSADELKARRASLLGTFARELETVDGAADNIADLALYNRPLAELSQFTANVQSVTPEQLKAAATASLAPDKTSLIVVGDAKTFAAGLKVDHPELEQISVDDLSFDTVTLQSTPTTQPSAARAAGRAAR